MSESEGRILRDEGDRCAELRAVTHGGLNLGARIAGDDPHVRYSGGDDRLDGIEEEPFVCHRNQLLGTGVRDRAQPGTLASAQDEPLHCKIAFVAASINWNVKW